MIATNTGHYTVSLFYAVCSSCCDQD